jgi:hypothetical protein
VAQAFLARGQPAWQRARGWGRGGTGGGCHLGRGGGPKRENWGAAVRWLDYLAGEDRVGGRGWGTEKEQEGWS